jgi:hypothetical protein
MGDAQRSQNRAKSADTPPLISQEILFDEFIVKQFAEAKLGPRLLFRVVRNGPGQRFHDLFGRNSRFLLRRLVELPLNALFFLHLALFHPLHFFLAFLKCRSHCVSSQALPGAA